MAAGDELHCRSRHKSSGSPILPFDTPACFKPIISDIRRPMLRVGGRALMPGQHSILMMRATSVAGHRRRPEREHVVSAIAANQSVVVESLTRIARFLPFKMLKVSKIADGTTEGTRDQVRR